MFLLLNGTEMSGAEVVVVGAKEKKMEKKREILKC